MILETKKPAVLLMGTCLIDAVRSDVGLSVVAVLEGLGYEVRYPAGQTCCGQVAFNGGLTGDAMAMARHTIEVFSEDLPLIIPSGSCADMVVHHYPELFAPDPVWHNKAQALAKRTYEFSQFLKEVVGLDKIKARFDGKVVYHASCHMSRSLGVTRAPHEVLARVNGAQVMTNPGAAECCGFGGLFSVKMADISGDMLRRKCDDLAKSGADTVVACDLSCMLHIGGGLARREKPLAVKHLAEILSGGMAP
jgi:L-lactate dehydrogenase complex protein LldE